MASSKMHLENSFTTIFSFKIHTAIKSIGTMLLAPSIHSNSLNVLRIKAVESKLSN